MFSVAKFTKMLKCTVQYSTVLSASLILSLLETVDLIASGWPSVHPNLFFTFFIILLKHSSETVPLYLSWWIGLDLASDPQLGLVLCVLDILDVHLYCDCGQICTAKVRGCSSQEKRMEACLSSLLKRKREREKLSFFHSVILWNLRTSDKCTLLTEHRYSEMNGMLLSYTKCGNLIIKIIVQIWC